MSPKGGATSVTAVAFGPADGLSSVEVNGGAQPSGLVASDGRLWFPTMGGVAVIESRRSSQFARNRRRLSSKSSGSMESQSISPAG